MLHQKIVSDLACAGQLSLQGTVEPFGVNGSENSCCQSSGTGSSRTTGSARQERKNTESSLRSPTYCTGSSNSKIRNCWSCSRVHYWLMSDVQPTSFVKSLKHRKNLDWTSHLHSKELRQTGVKTSSLGLTPSEDFWMLYTILAGQIEPSPAPWVVKKKKTSVKQTVNVFH